MHNNLSLVPISLIWLHISLIMNECALSKGVAWNPPDFRSTSMCQFVAQTWWPFSGLFVQNIFWSLLARSGYLNYRKEKTLWQVTVKHATLWLAEPAQVIGHLESSISMGFVCGFLSYWHCGRQRNVRWTMSKSGHPCPCQNCSQRPPTEKTGRGSLLNCTSWPPSPAPPPPNDPIGQGIELNFCSIVTVLRVHHPETRPSQYSLLSHIL